MTKPKKESWNSSLGVILAVSGSAVGLGNFLRFPGQVAEYGGGAFMLAYFLSFILIGLPICWAEWTLGRLGGKYGFNASPAILGSITRNPKFRFLGVIGIIIPIIIYMYYVLIEAWCLAYSTNYLLGNMNFEKVEDATSFFVNLIGATEDGSALKFGFQHVGFYVILVFILNFLLIWRGLSKGIEWFCKFAVPVLVLLAVLILVRVLTLGTPNPDFPDRNISNGLGFMWNPNKVIVEMKEPDSGEWNYFTEFFPGKDTGPVDAQLASLEDRLNTHRLEDSGAAMVPVDLRVVRRSMWEQLGNPSLWLAAASQIFFSLSVGFGIIITYASYLKKDDDLVLSGLSAASANEFCEVALGGLISIPAGVAFFGVAGLAGIGLGTFDIGFNVLPLVFAQMPAGAIFGFMFFFLLFLAAVTSSLSMLQPGIAYLEESLGLNRKQSVSVLGFITGVGVMFVLYFSKDLKALDTMDYWITNLFMVLLALVEIIVFSWVIGMDKGFREAHRGSAIRIPGIFRWIMKFVCPALLILIFSTWVVQQFGGTGSYNNYVKDLFIEPNKVAWMSVSLILLFAIFLLLTLPAASHLEKRIAQTKDDL